MIAVLVWVPLFVSAVMLVVLALAGGRGVRGLVVPAALFFVAAWLQFRAGSLLLSTTGLVLQALLAIYLYARVRLWPTD